MKTLSGYPRKNLFTYYLLFAVFIIAGQQGFSQTENSYSEIKGEILNSNTGDPVIAASVQLENSNLSTITNTEGEFLLKIPKTKNGSLKINALGYDSVTRSIAGNDLINSLTIRLDPSSVKLTEVNITSYKNARDLVEKVFENKASNYKGEKTIMTAFYRETIKKRNKNASLAEAVVSVYKQPYVGNKKDNIKLIKSRKNTDYTKLDTIALKLQGGPFSTLNIDLIKYPEYIFTEYTMEGYSFEFDQPTEVNGDPVYVVTFNQKNNVIDPLYKGALFINTKSLALVKANFSLNLSNPAEVNKLLVKKKPKDVRIRAKNIDYVVDYREKNGKWLYSYSKANLTFEVKKKRRLFKSTYSLTCEMAVTDWESNNDTQKWNTTGSMSPSIIMADAASGFSDPEFWGEYNVIEPEKSIKNAIKKIQKKLKKTSANSGAFGKTP